MTGPGDAIASLRFHGAWRRYQELALEAFERDRAAGRTRTHVVAPPGSGKTLLGVELIRRLGAPALVLAPNTAIQAQWAGAVASFLPEGADVAAVAGPSPDAPIACLTYQALCQLDDPDAAIGALATRRWAAERARATSRTVEEVEREAAAYDGEALRRRTREVARVTASIKREIARGEHHELGLDDLLGDGARARLDALVARGVATVVLDECHHLASLWGYVVRAVLERLPGAHLVGLTATPPDELTAEEQGLYEGLLGDVDFTVPTPAVVRDGFLAPYQELAWLVEPLEGERRWLAEHDLRFQELVTRLHDDEPTGPISFPGWVITRLRERGREGEHGEAVSWADFQRRHPALARAGVRFLASGGLALPSGAPRGEGYRQQPDLDDWLVLLEDYALRCLAPAPSPEAAARYEAVAAALRDLGLSLTRRGIRRGASDVDRLLTQSAAKPIALVEILALELAARGAAVRSLVLVDAELAPTRADDALVGVLAPGAGTGRAALRAIADDARTAPLRPLLVTGRGLRCAEEDGEALLELLGGTGRRRGARRRRLAPSPSRTGSPRSRRGGGPGSRAPGSASRRAPSPTAARAPWSARGRCSARAGTRPA
ncbi:MAG: DEAD/DEAH box helicase family protein [Thermoleophilia bacterium]